MFRSIARQALRIPEAGLNPGRKGVRVRPVPPAARQWESWSASALFGLQSCSTSAQDIVSIRVNRPFGA